MKKQLIDFTPIREQIKQKLIEQYDNTTYMNTDTINVQVNISELLDLYVRENNIPEPTIYITTQAYTKMRMLVDKTSTEIGWYGIVTKVPGLTSIYVIEDIIVYPQKVTGATCEQLDDKMFEFEMSLTTDQVNHKRFHGHSHVNMGTGPSGVDEQFYHDILTQVTDFFIVTVTNKRNEYTTRFYDMENNILFTDVPIQVIDDQGLELDYWYDESKKQLQEPLTVNRYYGNDLTNHKQLSIVDEMFNKDDEYWDDAESKWRRFDEDVEFYKSIKASKKNKKGKRNNGKGL